ncbi:hypothetical protein HanRHA438_Chr03g0103141 [Helianthus annuus]|nr:hypothetical protein HanIR_Chr03g0100281 [Helianthus annuus]KAJ0934063.1 hypothetical protein HanRHA438_Chr03g0103141 [Helianthus annuus]
MYFSLFQQAGKMVSLSFVFHHQQILHSSTLSNLKSQGRSLCLPGRSLHLTTYFYTDFTFSLAHSLIFDSVF